MDEVLEVIRPHIGPLARPFANPARPVESTADLLQESCLRAWQKIGKFETGTNDEETFKMFRAWVGQIVRRLGLTAQRNRQRQRRNPPKKILRLTPWESSESTDSALRIDVPSPDPTPSASARSDEQIRRVHEAIEKIPDETDAAIVRMHCIQGKTLQAVSQHLGLDYDKVRERYRASVLRMERDLKGLI